jgi:two-component system nitrate/nitrite response regulator NarP
MASIVVADDHPLMLDAVCRLFVGGGLSVVARCQDGMSARAAILEHQPDLALLDVQMPGLTGLDILADARSQNWRTRLMLLTAGVDAEPLVRAIRLNVDGLILKGSAADTLVRAAEAVLRGERWIDPDAMHHALGALTRDEGEEPTALTPRETDVVRCVVQGRRNKEIARDLGISEGTVKMHLHNLYEKLSVGSRTELALLALERKLG